MRRKGCNQRVVARNWPHLCSAAWRSNLGEEVNVDFVVVRPFAWKVILIVDSLHWTNRFTGSTVNTLVWVDVKHAVALVNAVDGAFIDASTILYIYAWKSNYISHARSINLGLIAIELRKPGANEPAPQALHMANEENEWRLYLSEKRLCRMKSKRHLFDHLLNCGYRRVASGIPKLTVEIRINSFKSPVDYHSRRLGRDAYVTPPRSLCQCTDQFVL